MYRYFKGEPFMKIVKQKAIPVGTVYCLNKYSNKAKISHDIANMAKCGLNVVMLWPMIDWDAKKKKPDFSRIDHVFSECRKRGLYVVPEVFGEVPGLEFAPSWKLAALEGDVFDSKSDHQNIRRPNLNHPRVKNLLGDYLTLVVNRYKDHPALLSWDVWDEPDPVFIDEFIMDRYRGWLKEKYGSLEKLMRCGGRLGPNGPRWSHGDRHGSPSCRKSALNFFAFGT
jgi:beta-galactosidase GanA